MKNKTLLTCTAVLFLALSNDASAQFYPSGTVAFANNNIDEIRFQPSFGAIRSIRANTDNYFEIYAGDGTPAKQGPALFMFGQSFAGGFAHPGSIWLNTHGSNGYIKMDTKGNTVNNPAFELINNGNNLFRINNGGNVGIGTLPSSNERLTINGDMWLVGSPTKAGTIKGGWGSQGLSFLSRWSGTDGASMSLMSSEHATHAGQVMMTAYTANAGSSKAYDFMIYAANTNTWKSPITIFHDEKVVIGDGIQNNRNGDYRLYVERGILTEKIKVATVSGGNWSDFVFADDYQLRDLSEVEDFIKENKHLPEIPSACDVEENGLDLVQMDSKLLQKVEELTLYVIELKKENARQQAKIEAMEKKLK